MFFFFKQKTAYEMRISDWSSDVCSSDLARRARHERPHQLQPALGRGAVEQVVEAMAHQHAADARRTQRALHRAAPSMRTTRAARRSKSDRKSTRLNSSH